MRSAAFILLFTFAAAAPSQIVSKPRPARARKATVTSQKPKLHHDASRSPESRWAGEPISLDVKDADLRDVLHTFAELTRLNMVVDPDVRGSVTVRLHDVPWDQALDLIVRTNGYGYVLEGSVLRVGKPSNL